ncbi:hypothetical protein KAK06_05470 [Ideonella sp. 4Y11]|uniref:Uncharacterized protein n=1 Tax=Ideonella aquatica TaxID=2824119 RepID=A0A940YHV3_9BURK|nr:hypothetical protein [Ideonella aquatica]MBQ0958401.1 hypothetical protein [Ideonella aquatica]
MHIRPMPFALAALVSLSALAASAQAAGHANADHPAVAQQRLATQAGIDTNHFLVQPPATVTWAVRTDAPVRHANADHPAVAQQRLAAQTGIDANHFLVQPPASVTWVDLPTPTRLAAVAR